MIRIFHSTGHSKLLIFQWIYNFQSTPSLAILIFQVKLRILNNPLFMTTYLHESCLSLPCIFPPTQIISSNYPTYKNFVPHCTEALRYAKVWGRDVVRNLTLAYAKRLFPDSNPLHMLHFYYFVPSIWFFVGQVAWETHKPAVVTYLRLHVFI